jgi:predicted AlkP superfamily phosphohydrolase/phosphomutase
MNVFVKGKKDWTDRMDDMNCTAKRRVSRRSFLQAGVAAASLSMVSGRVQAQKKGRAVVLGFDGVEPSVLEPMLAAGELPNLAKLKGQGTYTKLATTLPPQSPVAWTSFATCKNPGGHGIYDFIRRLPQDYLPDVGTGRLKQPVLGADGALVTPPQGVAYRKGETFWLTADKQGLRCSVINIPFLFPPDPMQRGTMLCGLGVPDVRGSSSTFFLFSDKQTKSEQVSGGIKMPLAFSGDFARADIEAIRDPRTKQWTKAPMGVTVDRIAHKITLEVGGKTISVAQGTWSEWVEWTLPLSDKYAAHAISRFYLLEAGENVRLYMSCLQFDPKDPYAPFSVPPNFSNDLAEKHGFFKTIGWSYDTHALRQDALTEEGFMDDVRQTMAWHETVITEQLERGDFDMLLGAWTATDRVAHMFWHYRDPKHPLYTEEGAQKYGRTLEEVYRLMDDIVGRIAAKLAPDDLLLVMSDHGFGSFRRGFNVNTWLVRNGYASLKGQTDPATASSDEAFLQGFDWEKTRAFCIGLSSMYLNLKGREGRGIVNPAEADALLREIRGKLLEVIDPVTGAKVFKDIYIRDAFKGECAADAPDIVFGYAENYQNAKSCAKGSSPAELYEDNKDKWSGEHASTDPSLSPGVLLSNRPLARPDADIRDIGPTLFQWLGATPAPDWEGRPLL